VCNSIVTLIAVGVWFRFSQPSAAYCFRRGIADFYKQAYDEAISDYGEAIGLNPQLADAYNNRAFAYHHLDEYDASQADFDKAKELGYTGQ